MIDKDLVSDGLHFLEKQGWSDLIDGRWETEVRKDLIYAFPNMNNETLQEIIDVVIW